MRQPRNELAADKQRQLVEAIRQARRKAEVTRTARHGGFVVTWTEPRKAGAK